MNFLQKKNYLYLTLSIIFVLVISWIILTSGALLKPEERIQGTWQVTSKISGGTVIDLTENSPEFIGLITTKEGSLKRRYIETDSPNSLEQIEKWKLVTTSDKKNILTFFDLDAEDLNDTNATEKYTVTFPTKNEMVLKRTYEKSLEKDEIRYVRIGDIEHELKKNYTRTEAETTLVCSTFNTPSETKLPNRLLILPITCSFPLNNKDELVSLTFSEDGNLYQTQEGKKVFELKQEGDEHIIAYNWQNIGFIDFNTIEFIDITYDGYRDLKVNTDCGAYNCNYDYYAYNPKIKTFNQKPILAGMVNSGEDTDKKTIVSFSKGRGMADIYVTETYHFENGGYALVKSEYQDFADSNCSTDDCSYVNIIKKRINGKMVVTEKEIRSWEDIWGE